MTNQNRATFFVSWNHVTLTENSRKVLDRLCSTRIAQQQRTWVFLFRREEGGEVYVCMAWIAYVLRYIVRQEASPRMNGDVTREGGRNGRNRRRYCDFSCVGT